MAQQATYFIETHYDKEGLIHHWEWEINTNSAVIRSRKPITKDKNQAFASLERHVRTFLRTKLNRMKVKNRIIGTPKQND